MQTSKNLTPVIPTSLFAALDSNAAARIRNSRRESLSEVSLPPHCTNAQHIRFLPSDQRNLCPLSPGLAHEVKYDGYRRIPFFTPMSGCFSLIDDYANPYQVPPERLVESHPCADVFEL
jgi:hypothetical protein